jgi:hypothetical protein
VGIPTCGRPTSVHQNHVRARGNRRQTVHLSNGGAGIRYTPHAPMWGSVTSPAATYRPVQPVSQSSGRPHRVYHTCAHARCSQCQCMHVGGGPIANVRHICNSQVGGRDTAPRAGPADKLSTQAQAFTAVGLDASCGYLPALFAIHTPPGPPGSRPEGHRPPLPPLCCAAPLAARPRIRRCPHHASRGGGAGAYRSRCATTRRTSARTSACRVATSLSPLRAMFGAGHHSGEVRPQRPWTACHGTYRQQRYRGRKHRHIRHTRGRPMHRCSPGQGRGRRRHGPGGGSGGSTVGTGRPCTAQALDARGPQTDTRVYRGGRTLDVPDSPTGRTAKRGWASTRARTARTALASDPFADTANLALPSSIKVACTPARSRRPLRSGAC